MIGRLLIGRMAERIAGFVILVSILTWMLWVPFVLWGAFWLLGVGAASPECQPAPIGC